MYLLVPPAFLRYPLIAQGRIVVVEAFEAVRQLKARQYAILESLPPHLLAEYEEIETTIRHLDDVIRKQGPSAKVDVPEPVA
jgi:hypothetical protein